MGNDCAYFVTCFCNLLFSLTGLLIFIIGITVEFNYWHYLNFVNDDVLTVPNILMIVGAVIAFVCFLGFCGAMMGNPTIISVFIILGTILFFFEIGIGAMLYIKRASLTNIIETQFNVTMQEYNEREDYRDAWNLLQTELACCGTLNSSDWSVIFKNDTLPPSCCEIIILNEADECTTAHANKEGCFVKLLALLESKTLILLGIILCVAAIQLLTIIFACCLSFA